MGASSPLRDPSCSPHGSQHLPLNLIRPSGPAAESGDDTGCLSSWRSRSLALSTPTFLPYSSQLECTETGHWASWSGTEAFVHFRKELQAYQGRVLAGQHERKEGAVHTAKQQTSTLFKMAVKPICQAASCSLPFEVMKFCMYLKREKQH